MKKVFNIIILFFILITLSSNVFASTNTMERTEDNLMINNDIEQNQFVIDAALKTPKVDETEKIYDFANLLSDSEEEKLYKEVKEYINKCKMDMAIVTIDQNNKYNAQQYADDFYDYNYFGMGNDYSGILFLIDMDTREIWISTEGKAIERYKDYIDAILDYAYEKGPDENPYKCAQEFIKKAKLYGNPNYEATRKTKKIIGASLIGGIVFSGIIVYFKAKKHKNVKREIKGDNYLNKSSINFTLVEDIFVETHTYKERIETESTSSGGSYRSSSSSSSHRSSSGRSHGGGGRRF